MSGDEGHYKGYADVYGTTTDESHHPSLQRRSKKVKTLPFASTLKYVKNVDMMLECEHCGRWRLLYCQQKLTKQERESLQEALADVSFTCGAPLQELELPGKLANVYVRDISCEEPIERLYYTAMYPPICVYWAHSVSDKSNSEFYPQCPSCGDKSKIPKS